MERLDAFIDRVQDLPAAPRLVPELLMLLNQPDIDSSRVVDLITYDPGLTANVLRVCNSAFLGGLQPAENLPEAITRLGFRQVYQLVAAVSGSRALCPPQPGYGLAPGELWKHSVTSAVAAKFVARDLGGDESLVFTAGLLHDIGKIVLSEALTDEYARILEETEGRQRSRRETEKHLLGVEHAEIGGRLLHRWKLPPSLVAAVWFHHTPAQAGEHTRLAAFVYLGNMIAHCIGHTSGYQSFALRGRTEVFDILRLRPGQWPRYLVRTWENLQLVRALLDVEG